MVEDLIKNAQRIQAEVEKTDEAWQKQADTVRESLKTENEKLEDQLNLLIMLHGQGKLTDEELSKGIEKINKSLDTSGKSWQEFGKEVGNTIKLGSLFGSSWKEALQSLSLDFAQLILKLTLFRSLSASAGPTGFLGSLLSGLAGLGGGGGAGSFNPGNLATGGPADAGKIYHWQEHGQEYFVPTQNGVVIPSGASTSSDKSTPPTIIQHFHGVTDMDSFKASKDQVAAQMFAMMATAQRRNG
jgi:hypothetical protein